MNAWYSVPNRSYVRIRNKKNILRLANCELGFSLFTTYASYLLKQIHLILAVTAYFNRWSIIESNVNK